MVYTCIASVPGCFMTTRDNEVITCGVHELLSKPSTDEKKLKKHKANADNLLENE